MNEFEEAQKIAARFPEVNALEVLRMIEDCERNKRRGRPDKWPDSRIINSIRVELSLIYSDSEGAQETFTAEEVAELLGYYE